MGSSPPESEADRIQRKIRQKQKQQEFQAKLQQKHTTADFS